jgi:hypothetical protein
MTATPNNEAVGVSVAGFKNFHRSLCARFGYVHDEEFWWRDLVSLEEHIATLTPSPAPGGGDAVAWQYKDADWKEWASITREQFDKYTSMPQSDSWTARALYDAPPASVPVEKLRELADELRTNAYEQTSGLAGNTMLIYANKITALAQEHDQ